MNKETRKNDILVSIVIPTFNRERVIKRAIKSALNQSYKNIEIIIVDDGSTDKTKDIVESFREEIKKKKIRYIYQENKGVSIARNIGALNARGDYISFLDSDDSYLPNKIEKHLSKVIRNNVDFSICEEIQIRNGFPSFGKKRNEDILLDINSFVKNFPSHSASLFFIKREKFLKYLFDENKIVLDDTEFILRYLGENKILLIKDILVERYKDLKETRLSLDKKNKLKSIKEIISNVERGDYIIEKEEKDNFLFRLYFQIGVFNILDKNKKEAKRYFIMAKNIKSIIFFKKIKSFLIIIFLYLPFSNFMIISLGKILWKFRIVEGK